MLPRSSSKGLPLLVHPSSTPLSHGTDGLVREKNMYNKYVIKKYDKSYEGLVRRFYETV